MEKKNGTPALGQVSASAVSVHDNREIIPFEYLFVNTGLKIDFPVRIQLTGFAFWRMLVETQSSRSFDQGDIQ